MGCVARVDIVDPRYEWLLARFLRADVHGEFLRSGNRVFDWHSRLIAKVFAHSELGPLVTSLGAATKSIRRNLDPSLANIPR